MTTPTIEFWFEFASTYSHITAQRIESLAARQGVAIAWRPFLLGPIFKAQGWDTSPFNIYEAKGAYMWRDVARACEKEGIAFRRPSAFPRNGLLAARVATAAESEPFMPAFVRGIYLANFRDDLDISSPSVVTGVLRDAGCDGPGVWLERAASAPVKDALRGRNDEAVRRGVFGSPSLFAGGELFWGNDRVDDALAWALRAPVSAS